MGFCRRGLWADGGADRDCPVDQLARDDQGRKAQRCAAKGSQVKAKHQRLILALVALTGVAGAGVLAASALRDEAAYFRTPVEIKGGKAEIGEAMRLGGMVAKGSIERQADGLTIRFVATDGKASVPVEDKGIVDRKSVV